MGEEEGEGKERHRSQRPGEKGVCWSGCRRGTGKKEVAMRGVESWTPGTK